MRRGPAASMTFYVHTRTTLLNPERIFINISTDWWAAKASSLDRSGLVHID